jgi:hypothetical protein
MKFIKYGDSSSTCLLENFLLVPKTHPFTAFSSLTSNPVISLASAFLSTTAASVAGTITMPFSSLNPAGSDGRLVVGIRPRHIVQAGNVRGVSLGCSSRFFSFSSKTSRELFCVAAASAIICGIWISLI